MDESYRTQGCSFAKLLTVNSINQKGEGHLYNDAIWSLARSSFIVAVSVPIIGLVRIFWSPHITPLEYFMISGL